MITPCLWFNAKAKEAAQFYFETLLNTKIIAESPMVVDIEVDGSRITCLDGGSMYTPNPSISLSYTCVDEGELNRVWNAFADEGQVLMEIGSYPWSARYGWVNDKYGVSWQLILSDRSESKQKITPALMFTREQYGRAEEAINFYTSVFQSSHIDGIYRYTADEAPDQEGKISHAEINLAGSKLMLLESALDHKFTFSEGVSLMIHCNSQSEIDHYWQKLTEGGKESMCGWLTDKFGVSWQVVPDLLTAIMQDPVKAPKAAQAFMQMRKIEIDKLLKAIE